MRADAQNLRLLNNKADILVVVEWEPLSELINDEHMYATWV